jgi:hypothetical protein
MSCLASLAQLANMWPLTVSFIVHRHFHILASTPFLQTIDDALHITLLIHLWFPNPMTLLAVLVIDSSVVLIAPVQADSDCDFLAGPDVMAAAPAADEFAHNIGVIGLDAAFVRVVGVEGKFERWG